MLVISNGPFMLKIYDPPAQYAELIAFRDETYPFKPGQFYYGSANLVEIVDINTNFIELNSDNEIILKLIGEGNLGLRYALINEINNEILSNGIASEKSTNEFVINLDSTLTSNLRPGFYKLHLAGFSDALSSVSARVIVLEAVSDRPVVPVVSQQINEEKPQSENPINQNNIDEKPQSEESSSLILPLIVALVIIIGGVFVMQRSQTTSKRVVRKTSSRSRSSKKSGLKSSKKTTKKTTATKKTISTKKPKKSIRKSSKKYT